MSLLRRTQTISTTYDLGADAYGRPTHLIRGSDGTKTGWILVRGHANRGGEQERVSLLTDQQIAMLGMISAEEARRSSEDNSGGSHRG